MRTLLSAKIHRATITAADLDYVGSITLDADLLDAAGICEWEQVHVVDVTNGARLVTYAIKGERGSGDVQINGAAAHLVRPGDTVIVLTYLGVPDDAVHRHRPRIVHVDARNRAIDFHAPRVDDEPAQAVVARGAHEAQEAHAASRVASAAAAGGALVTGGSR